MLFNKAETIDCLTSNHKIISHWKQLSLTDEQVESFFTLLRSDILQSINTKDQLDSLAKDIATERFVKKISLEDFTNTITSGRSLLMKEVLSLESSAQEKSEILNEINRLLDQFIHLTLTHYSRLQEKSLEEQYYFISQTHKDRLTLLGQMTSSFVHEFRNPLTSIMGFIQLLQSEQSGIKYLDII
jgi:signal transduction histidine kinase